MELHLKLRPVRYAKQQATHLGIHLSVIVSARETFTPFSDYLDLNRTQQCSSSKYLCMRILGVYYISKIKM
jgi:hypothetical protein